MTLPAVILAAIAACGYAVGARLQHGAVHDTVARGGLGLRGGLRLVRNNRWLMGLACLAFGAALHALSLGLAPLSVVQPVGVLALPIAVLLGAREEGRRITELHRTALAGVFAATGGVSMFVVLAVGSATSTPVTTEAAGSAIRLVALLVLLLGIIGLLSNDRMRCLAYATGCAVAYGLVSMLTRAVSQQVTSWQFADIAVRPVLGIVVAVLVGGWLLQHAYASGPPDLVVACLTVIDPMVAVGLGIGLLGEADSVGFGTAVGEALCAAIACAGVFALARYHPQNRPQKEAETQGEFAGTTSIDRS